MSAVAHVFSNSPIWYVVPSGDANSGRINGGMRKNIINWINFGWSTSTLILLFYFYDAYKILK